MSKNKQSNYDITEVELPIKRVTGDTVEDVLTSNAYNNILPARYLKKDEDGNVIEDPAELFERVAKNVALADTVYKAEDNNVNIKATPQDIKPEASSNRRQDLCEEIFGEDVSLDDDVSIDVEESNLYAFAYDTIVPKLPDNVAEEVHATAEKFEEDMTNLSFMPNSPTLMNAGDDFQQLSACFVDSPDDDINNIHETAKEAAKIFQCLTEDTIVETDEGRKKIIDVSKGDKILQRGDSDTQFATVQDIFVYDDAPTVTITLKSGQEITGTPNHDLLVNGDWKSIGEIQNDDNLHIPINYDIPESNEPELKPVESGSQWESDVNVEEIIRLHSEGYNDHEIADRIESSSSTVQRWRSNRLDLKPNNKSGAKKGQNVEFNETRAKELYSQGLSDLEISKELDISKSAVRSFRIRNSLDRNNVAVKDVQQPDNFTSNLAELVGIWIGDGSFHEDGVRFHIRRDSVKEHIEDICIELFDVKPDSNWSGGCYEMCIHSHEIKRWWKENFGEYKPSSSESSVPDIVFKSGENEISSFIRGLFTADGSLNRNKYPTLTTVSNDLASDIQSLLVRIGIPAKDHTDISDNNIDSEYERHYVGVTTETGLSRYPEIVGWIDEERSLENSVSIQESSFKSGQHGYVDNEASEWIVPIESVTEEDKQSVYDISVEGKSEYIANDIVSHNSGGGMGYAFTNLRPYGDRVGSTGGIASGPISFMRTFDQMCGTIAQGGKRRGAQMGILRIDHPDIIQYIHAKDEDVSLAHELKLNDPDDFTHNSFGEALEEARELVTVDENGVKKVEPHLRNAAEGHLSNFNISVGVTDDFMEAVKNDEQYDMINPRTGEPHIATEETKELYGWFDLGDEVEVGEPLSVPAREIYERITKGAWENGEPGMIFLERANKMHSFDVDEHPEHEILATNPCVTGDTLVATADGRGAVPIEELTDEEDVQIYTRTGDGVGVALANNIRKTREDADLVEITTDGEVSLECTEDHPIWTRNRGWVEAGNLKEGDSLHILYETDHNSGYNNVTWTDDEDQWNLEHRLVARDLLDMDISGYTIHHEDGNKTNNNSENLSVIDPSEHGAKHARDISGEDNPIHKLKEDGKFEEYKEDNLFYDTEGENNPMYGKSHSEETKEKIADSDYEERSKKVSETIQKQYDEGKPVECKECGEEFKSLNLHLSSHNMSVQDYREKYGDEVRLSAAQPVENHKVVSVEPSGSEDVYDLEVPETHNFYAGDTDGEYINIHNCGEQPLEEYEACNLGHINLSTLVDKESPDWREYESEEDSLEKQVGDFLSDAIDWSLLDRRIHNGTHFLENVVTMSDFPVDEITEKVGSNRKIGLGIMGLAQMYVQLGTRYGSEVSNEIARQLMSYINHESKRESHKIATGKSEYTERGSFNNWHKSKYSDPTEYSEWFEKLTGQDPEEWEDGYKIRNHNTTTIAPTGTTSMIGDTTGGCEPIYDVAYYKNVSGDVQGDEMLVEFDDYFLRTLKANNIDIDPVKEEAEKMMSNNNFEGVDSLETVPDAIGELFITTSDLSALEHARVQCALQEGVDSAISKTVNAPEDATPEDAQDAFMEVYDKGGKGVTYYRDGTRSKQVLTTREDNQGEDEEQDPVDLVKQKLESGELDASDLGLEQDKSEEVVTDNTVEPKSRPKSLVGVTKELDTRYGDLFVTINETEEGEPFEVFANIGKSGGYTESFTESTARLISLCLRCGIKPETIIDQIEGIRSPRVSWDQGDQIYSVPDGIALALRRYSNEDHQVETVETDEDLEESESDQSEDTGRSVIDSGENPECPKCSSLSLYYSEGCKTCESCGWSEC